MQRLSTFVAISSFAFVFSTAANAACPTYHTLSNGSTADATQVMDNFSYVLTCPTIVNNGSGDADVNVLNNSSASNASSRVTVTNGTSSGLLVQYGTGYTASGILRQDGTLVYGNGAGGLTLDTGTTQPIYFGINGIEVARLTASDFHVGANTNQDTSLSVANGNTGSIANARLTLSNGTSSGLLVQYGSNYTTFGMLRQDGTLVFGNGAGGLTLDTGAAQPIYFGVNSSEVARFNTNGYLLVGYTSSNGAYKLQVNSQIFATSSTIATSDRRLKNDLGSPSANFSRRRSRYRPICTHAKITRSMACARVIGRRTGSKY